MVKIIYLIVAFCCFHFFGHAEEDREYQFHGRHFIANYTECDKEALSDVKELAKAFVDAVQECGATLLDSSYYVFEPNGMTMMVLLSESHASIHTYPEHNACFVDLFTCGTSCSAEKFDQALRSYLKPAEVVERMLIRNEQVACDECEHQNSQ